MQFLYRTQATRPEMLTDGPTPEERATVERHFAYVKDLTERGTMILVGRTQNNDPSCFGIAIFQADSEAAARAVMENDPAVREGVMHGDLFPYRIALLNTANV